MSFQAQNDVFEDEMNSFGGASVLACLAWLLFSMDLRSHNMWTLPFFSALFLLAKDGLMIRYGERDEPKKAANGTLIAGKVKYDDGYWSHSMYILVALVRCWGLTPGRMGVVHYMPSEWWAAMRYGLVAMLSAMMAVEAVLAKATRNAKDKKELAKQKKQASGGDGGEDDEQKGQKGEAQKKGD